MDKIVSPNLKPLLFSHAMTQTYDSDLVPFSVAIQLLSYYTFFLNQIL